MVFLYNCLPTKILVLAVQGGCVRVIYITVKQKKKHKITTVQHRGGPSIQVVSNIGCTVFVHIHCVTKT